jgi:hypothetical protein
LRAGAGVEQDTDDGKVKGRARVRVVRLKHG